MTLHYKSEEVTTADVAMPPSNYAAARKRSGETWQMFSVSPDIFRRFETGRNRFERWSNYFDLSDDNQKEIYEYATKNPSNTIILQCSSTGVMRSIRKRAANESKTF
jgi:hypothetical protein